jgi:hypothetical protein
MAALLLGAIGISAHKIKEKRDERKKKKALAEWEDEQVAEYRRKAGSSGSRKSEEARASEREVEDVAPPRYEDVVDERGQRGNGGRSGRSMLDV